MNQVTGCCAERGRLTTGTQCRTAVRERRVLQLRDERGDEKGDGEERPVCVEPRQGRQSRQFQRVVVLNVDVEL